MNAARPDSPVIRFNVPHPKKELPESPKRESAWPLRQWFLIAAVILVAHVAAVFIFGEYQFPPVRTVKDVPQLQLANNSSELIALNDPTLFALPHARDFVLLKMPEMKPPAFRWTEPPRWLPLASKNLGATFNQFMRTNLFYTSQMNFKPPPKWSAPAPSFQPTFAENSKLLIEGELKQRKLFNQIILPDWPYAGIIAPSKIQALVDANGDVVSAVSLPFDDLAKAESRYAAADQRALEITRAMQFAPSSHLTVGVLIFKWRTVPPIANSNP